MKQMKKLIEVKIISKRLKEKEGLAYGSPARDDHEICVSVDGDQNLDFNGREAELIEMLKTKIESL